MSAGRGAIEGMHKILYSVAIKVCLLALHPIKILANIIGVIYSHKIKVTISQFIFYE